MNRSFYLVEFYILCAFHFIIVGCLDCADVSGGNLVVNERYLALLRCCWAGLGRVGRVGHSFPRTEVHTSLPTFTHFIHLTLSPFVCLFFFTGEEDYITSSSLHLKRFSLSLYSTCKIPYALPSPRIQIKPRLYLHINLPDISLFSSVPT